MQRGPVDRMVRRADPHPGGDGAEFTDLGIGDDAVRAQIREVAERGVLDAGAFQHLAMPADDSLAQGDTGIDDGFGDFGAFWVHDGRPSALPAPLWRGVCRPGGLIMRREGDAKGRSGATRMGEAKVKRPVSRAPVT